MAPRRTNTVIPGYMQMMAEKAAVSRKPMGSGSASGSGTASVSTTPTPPLHAGTTSPVKTGTPPTVHVGTPTPVHVRMPPPVQTGPLTPPHVPDVPAAPDGDVPGPVHPELNVPGHVPYATLRVENILAQPRHNGLHRLDPHKSADTYCKSGIGMSRQHRPHGLGPLEEALDG
ncbi:unnamed protein product [Cochlearia groenlandica]